MKKFVSSALGFGGKCKVEIEFDDSTGPSVSVGSASPPPTTPCFTNRDTVSGIIRAIPLSLKKVDHLGIRAQLVGEVVLKSNKHRPHEFLSKVQDLAPSGDLTAIETFKFEFRNVDMPYETYAGSQVTLRYSVRVILARSIGQTLIQDHFFDVRNPMTREQISEIGVITSNGGASRRTEVNNNDDAAGSASAAAVARVREDSTIKMEVGIEDCLHIEFEYKKNAYHLNDVVIGRINFLLVRIKLKHMELEIKRRETVGSGIDAHLEIMTVSKYEIMDGAPAKGESVPIRMYLSPYPLTPSYDNVHGEFSVKYSLNLVLVDQEDRRYFKQHEITLYRLTDESCGPPAWNLVHDVKCVNGVTEEDGGDDAKDDAEDTEDDGAPRETNGASHSEAMGEPHSKLVLQNDDLPDENGWKSVPL